MTGIHFDESCNMIGQIEFRICRTALALLAKNSGNTFLKKYKRNYISILKIVFLTRFIGQDLGRDKYGKTSV